jgi:hypothetical protein
MNKIKFKTKKKSFHAQKILCKNNFPSQAAENWSSHSLRPDEALKFQLLYNFLKYYIIND